MFRGLCGSRSDMLVSCVETETCSVWLAQNSRSMHACSSQLGFGSLAKASRVQ